MSPRVWSLAALGALLGASPAPAAVDAVAEWRSRLGVAHVAGVERPELVLAQRAIEREWPAPGDTGFVWFQGKRSEVAAFAMSAAVPGAGQLYAGKTSGLWFAAAEIAGWLGWAVLRGKADDLRADARALAGAPEDTTSAWSFARWAAASQQDPAEIQSLYAGDRDAFDEAIASDPRYASGWSSADARASFADLRDRSDSRLRQSRAAEGALWVNHVLAALDAVRAARIHNLPLRSGVELDARAGWARGGPTWRLALERRFP